jgi:hypothetical protein
MKLPAEQQAIRAKPFTHRERSLSFPKRMPRNRFLSGSRKSPAVSR